MGEVADSIKTVKDLLPTMGKEAKEFIPTQFSSLDDLLDGGFAKKEMVVIGGPSGVGKSFLACQFLINAIDNGFSALYVSLEISTNTILSRLIGNYCGIKPFRLISGLLEPDEYKRLKEAKAEINLLNDYIYLTDSIYKLNEIVEAVELVKPDIVFVDFIQSVLVPDTSGSYEALSETALTLQKTAKSQDCVVVVFSQLSNRVAQSDGDHELLEYKGSGTIAQVADLGFWLYGEDVGERNKGLTLYLRKNRRGVGYRRFPLKIEFPNGRVVEDEAV